MAFVSENHHRLSSQRRIYFDTGKGIWMRVRNLLSEGVKSHRVGGLGTYR